MIGGIVTALVAKEDRIWVDCEEKNSTSKCAIYVKRTEQSQKIKPGDSIWWQGGFALWTPFENTRSKHRHLRGGVDYDIRIPRIGCSGVAKPR